MNNDCHSNSNSVVLDRIEAYDPTIQTVWPFKHVNDIVEGIMLDLGNMVSSYPFEVNGVKWRSSEELYLAGEFSLNTSAHQAIQAELRSAKSPYAAKRFVKSKYRKQVREDFNTFRTQWMLWCAWQKCRGNSDFRKKLLLLPENITLVEETTTDTGGSASVWGCSNKQLVEVRKAKVKELSEKNAHLTKKALAHLINIETNAIRDIGQYKGQNNLGKIIMICRNCLKRGLTPEIDFDLLNSKNIHILGKRLSFIA